MATRHIFKLDDLQAWNTNAYLLFTFYMKMFRKAKKKVLLISLKLSCICVPFILSSPNEYVSFMSIRSANTHKYTLAHTRINVTIRKQRTFAIHHFWGNEPMGKHLMRTLSNMTILIKHQMNSKKLMTIKPHTKNYSENVFTFSSS